MTSEGFSPIPFWGEDDKKLSEEDRWLRQLDPRVRTLYETGQLSEVDKNLLQGSRMLDSYRLKKETRLQKIQRLIRARFQRQEVYAEREKLQSQPPLSHYEQRKDRYEPDEVPRWLVTEEKIGRGGVGAVYRGYDLRLRKFVAVKEILTKYGDDPQLRQSMEIEAKTLARLSHPNLVEVYDFLVEGNKTYIVMQLIPPGEYHSLREKVDYLGLQKILQSVTEICDVIDYCAKKGLTHQDLKPDNILINEEGSVKVLDFGISNWSMIVGENRNQKMPRTAAYSTPETESMNAEKRASVTSEIFNMGSILYEMITGDAFYRLNIIGDEEYPIIGAAQLSQEQEEKIRTATAERGFVAQKIIELINKSHKLDPQKRQQSGAEFARELFSAIDIQQVGLQKLGTEEEVQKLLQQYFEAKRMKDFPLEDSLPQPVSDPIRVISPFLPEDKPGDFFDDWDAGSVGETTLPSSPPVTRIFDSQEP